MGFIEYLKTFLTVIVKSMLWFFGGLIVIVLGSSFIFASVSVGGNSIIGQVGNILGIIVIFVGVGMILYAYHRYSHSIYVRKRHYEV